LTAKHLLFTTRGATDAVDRLYCDNHAKRFHPNKDQFVNDHSPQQAFNQENAAQYDKKREKLSAIKDALHLLTQAVLSPLAGQARVLCVGAGTGAELLYLANSFPQWRFTVVEPASAMMSLCQQKARAGRIDARCEFHQGYLDTLPEGDVYDAATSILVAQFILERQQRIAFYTQIARRLRQGGYFVNAELAGDIGDSAYENLLQPWIAMPKLADIDFNPSVFGKAVAVSSKEDIEDMLADAGFSEPVLYYQALLIHAWYSRRE